MLHLIVCFFLLTVTTVLARPQVPYDYIPLGIEEARRNMAEDAADDVIAPHASDVSLLYEKLFPARRRYRDAY
ncbi:hypothetical protein JYU34_003037 [Plutella xylostella]|uniref:Uncharacterized protein n=1 Tax=Plutella xylostella TaxID=51655 RepID=A0ABQ7QZ03_PLUXY|nr:hypothetical protein JYU34_003037 [Plutella xylostella]